MNATNSNRITTRVPERVKQIIATAAAIDGLSINQFIAQAALTKAQEIINQEQALIEKERAIHLKVEDMQVFLAALEHPAKANDYLKRAAQRRR